ncbi:MAG TPA: hypothetical protein VK466_13645, partial [Terriglobales bacterium]|nr:hypothetical protein [Terriglobales bacterium]
AGCSAIELLRSVVGRQNRRPELLHRHHIKAPANLKISTAVTIVSHPNAAAAPDVRTFPAPPRTRPLGSPLPPAKTPLPRV